MGKLVVTNSVMIQGSDLKSYGEHPIKDDLRDYINLDSSNPFLTLENVSDAKFLTVHNSANITPDQALTSGNPQFLYAKHLGIFKDEHIWIARKGTTPCLKKNKLYKDWNTPGTYEITYSESEDKITVIDPNNKKSVFESRIIYMTVTGAGGGGQGSYYYVDYYVVWAKQEATIGGNGGCGGVYSCLIDMSKAKKVTVTLGSGGAGSNGSDAPTDGGNSSFKCGNVTITINGGLKGTRAAIANVSTIDWDLDWDYDTQPANGGSCPNSLSIPGVYLATCSKGADKASSYSKIINNSLFVQEDKKSLIFSSSGLKMGYGGAGASCPNKPPFNEEYKNKGSDGANGGLIIMY